MERKFNKKLIIGIIVVAAAAISGIVATVIIFQPQDNIDSRIRSLMSQASVPSLSAGIVVNDTLVWSKGYGDQPDGLDTVYMIGSITKIFTATAIMQLYENGSLGLNTDINDYLPFNVSHPHPSFSGIPITPRMLLSHTSAIGNPDIPLWDLDADFINWANNTLGWNLTAWDPRPTLGEFLNGSLNPAGPYYEYPGNWEPIEPGTDWQYSNLAFLLLAYIVEEITNQSYIEYLQENVLSPLGMTSTGFNYTDFIGRNAIPYEQEDTQLIEGPIYNWYNIGGGALRSTVPDLAKFLIVHMKQGSYNNTQILLPQTVDLMQTAEISLSGNDFGGYTFVGQGLGWPLYADNIIGHSGGIPGFLAQIAFKTVSNGKYGIVFMLNKGSSLVHDTHLLNTFIPSIIEVLFDEAAMLFSL
jgi:CubicO group peptidase (beta-lactamase class C family)